ncbi:Aflatoxin B1 Aldehyde Reductase Member 3 [Manis pentadactyla]|nr:Aflatoxin B1 Aldehyde Reductase Member 3 [Manis pentadactyla]
MQVSLVGAGNPFQGKRGRTSGLEQGVQRVDVVPLKTHLLLEPKKWEMVVAVAGKIEIPNSPLMGKSPGKLKNWKAWEIARSPVICKQLRPWITPYLRTRETFVENADSHSFPIETHWDQKPAFYTAFPIKFPTPKPTSDSERFKNFCEGPAQ